MLHMQILQYHISVWNFVLLHIHLEKAQHRWWTAFSEYDHIKSQESNMTAHSFHAHLAYKPEKSNVLNRLPRLLVHYAAHGACAVVTLPHHDSNPLDTWQRISQSVWAETQHVMGSDIMLWNNIFSGDCMACGFFFHPSPSIRNT